VALDILDVVELGCQRVVDIDDDDLPVSLLLVEERHDAEDLDLLDLAGVADELADLAHIERVVVALGLGLGVDDVGVFPGLVGVCKCVCCLLSRRTRGEGSYLGEGAVVPEVALVGEAVADEAELLDGVEGLLLGDLEGYCQHGFWMRRRCGAG
jgi:hypothetical protein